jgi:glycosyltransferase involved in cell wall biosynthesis
MATVSVLIPNYNHAEYLKQRIDSVLNQTYRDFEVIILDDCSKDNSREIIETYRGNAKVSHIVMNARNTGSPFRQWKKGLGYATGDYIWIAESDDYASPAFLETVMSRFSANKGLSMVYARSVQVDEKDQPMRMLDDWLSEISPVKWSSDYVSEGRNEIKECLSIRNTIPNASAVVIDRKALESSINKITGFRITGDWYLWLNILSSPGARLGFVAEKLNFFRQHSRTTRKISGYAPRHMTEWLKCLFFPIRKKITSKPAHPLSVQDVRWFWSPETYENFSKVFSFRNIFLTWRYEKKIVDDIWHLFRKGVLRPPQWKARK